MQYLECKGVKIPFIFEKNFDFPVVILKLVFSRCGRSYDEVAGVARLFARLLNEGTDDKFFKELEFRAIGLEASSGFENLEINLYALKEQSNFAINALKRLLSQPRFEQKILDRLKAITLGEMVSKQNDFDELAKNLLDATVFETKEFQTPNEGDEDSLKEISLDNLKTFYKNFIHLNNLTVVLGGALQEKEAKNVIEDLLSHLAKGKKSPDKHYTHSTKNKEEVLVKKESEQAYIYFSTPFFADFKDEDLYLAKVALFILGQGGFGSRLMEEIRVKRGLAYSAYAMLDMKRSYSRVFGYLQTKNEKALEAKKIVCELFENFVKKGANETELNLAKNFLLGSEPLRYESLEKRLGMAFGEFYQGLSQGQLKKELQKVKKLDLKTLNDYIKKHKELCLLSFASVQNEN